MAKTSNDVLRTQNEALSAENDVLRTKLRDSEAHVLRLQLILRKAQGTTSKWRAACLIAKVKGCTVQEAMASV